MSPIVMFSWRKYGGFREAEPSPSLSDPPTTRLRLVKNLLESLPQSFGGLSNLKACAGLPRLGIFRGLGIGHREMAMAQN